MTRQVNGRLGLGRPRRASNQRPDQQCHPRDSRHKTWFQLEGQLGDEWHNLGSPTFLFQALIQPWRPIRSVFTYIRSVSDVGHSAAIGIDHKDVPIA